MGAQHNFVGIFSGATTSFVANSINYFEFILFEIHLKATIIQYLFKEYLVLKLEEKEKINETPKYNCRFSNIIDIIISKNN